MLTGEVKRTRWIRPPTSAWRRSATTAARVRASKFIGALRFFMRGRAPALGPTAVNPLYARRARNANRETRMNGERDSMNPIIYGRPPEPLLVVLSGPSGVGKDSALMRMRELGFPFHFVVTATDRPQRPGEINGVDYHFL